MCFPVFFDLPGPELIMNKQGMLKFSVKAPRNSTFTVWHNNDQITNPDMSDEEHATCGDVPTIQQSSTDKDDTFSLYYAEIKASNINPRC